MFFETQPHGFSASGSFERSLVPQGILNPDSGSFDNTQNMSPTCIGVALNGVWAIVDLTRNNAKNTHYLGSIGACLAAVNAMTIHRSSER